jgi:uncharacterized protein (UPF0335 family)
MTKLSNTQATLRDAVDRIERIEEEKAQLADDQKVIYAEIKAAGFNTKVVRQVIARRKMDPKLREELDSLVELYTQTLDGEGLV